MRTNRLLLIFDFEFITKKDKLITLFNSLQMFCLLLFADFTTLNNLLNCSNTFDSIAATSCPFIVLSGQVSMRNRFANLTLKALGYCFFHFLQ